MYYSRAIKSTMRITRYFVNKAAIKFKTEVSTTIIIIILLLLLLCHVIILSVRNCCCSSFADFAVATALNSLEKCVSKIGFPSEFIICDHVVFCRAVTGPWELSPIASSVRHSRFRTQQVGNGFKRKIPQNIISYCRSFSSSVDRVGVYIIFFSAS